MSSTSGQIKTSAMHGLVLEADSDNSLRMSSYGPSKCFAFFLWPLFVTGTVAVGLIVFKATTGLGNGQVKMLRTSLFSARYLS